jgi:hypothetical protein
MDILYLVGDLTLSGGYGLLELVDSTPSKAHALIILMGKHKSDLLMDQHDTNINPQ